MIRNGEQVVSVEDAKDRFVVKSIFRAYGERDEIFVDAVVAGLGILPNVELAQAGRAGNRQWHPCGPGASHQSRGHLRSRRRGRVFQPRADTYLRVEHEDNANTMGEMAGRSMAGEPVSYDHLPFFYSDLF